MRGLFLLSVILLLGNAFCGVDREFQQKEAVEEFQIPSGDNSKASDVDNDVIENSESDNSSETSRLWNKIITVKNGGPWGTWGRAEFCPGDSHAVGYDMKIEPKVRFDNTALNAIKLICANAERKVTGEITSTQGRWGSWVGQTKCTGDRHMSAFDLQVEKKQGSWKDDTAANYVKFKCRCHCGHSYVLVKPPGHGLWGTWGAWSASCPKRSGICGIQTKVEKYQGKFGDDTALNDVKFYCCELPNKTEEQN